MSMHVRSTAVPQRLARPGPFGLEGPFRLLVVCLVGTLFSSSYNTMLNVALPQIGQRFGADLTLVQWVVLSYLLITSSTIVISGRLGDLFGARRIYRVGLMVFGLGGLACALAPSLPALLVLRPLQALGASLYIVSVPTILTEAFPDRQRGQIMGLYSMAAYGGISAGPVLGGLVTEWFGWRGVFALAAPVAVATLWLVWHHMPLDRSHDRAGGFDLLGSLAFIGTIAPLLLALTRVQQWGLTSPAVLGLLTLGALAGAVFLLAERRAAAPLVDLQIFSRRYLALSALAAVAQYMALQSVVFLMPFYLVQARGLSPSTAGLLLTAQPICMIVLGPLVGLLTDRAGSALPGTIGAALVAGALLLLAQVGADTSFVYLAASLAVVGAGAAFGNVANNTAMMGAVPPSRRGMASGTIGTARYMGQALGVALASTLFALAAGAQVGPSSWPGFAAAFLAMSGVATLSAACSAARGQRPSFG